MNAYENKATETQAYEALRIAQIEAETSNTSAKHCAIEAERFFNTGRYGFAHEWAIESLKHSVGIFNASLTKLMAERTGGK